MITTDQLKSIADRTEALSCNRRYLWHWCQINSVFLNQFL